MAREFEKLSESTEGRPRWLPFGLDAQARGGVQAANRGYNFFAI